MKGSFSDKDKVLMGALIFITESMISNPIIWEDLRWVYLEEIKISTAPTEWGIWELDV